MVWSSMSTECETAYMQLNFIVRYILCLYIKNTITSTDKAQSPNNPNLYNPLPLLKFACVGDGESFQLFWVAGSRNIKTRYDNYLHPRLSCSPRSATWFVYFFEQKGNSHS